MEPYVRMGIVFYGFSWIYFVFFRYYFLPSCWYSGMKIVASGLYGVSFALFVLLYYPVSMEQLIWAILWSICSVAILIINFE